MYAAPNSFGEFKQHYEGEDADHQLPTADKLAHQILYSQECQGTEKWAVHRSGPTDESGYENFRGPARFNKAGIYEPEVDGVK